MGGQSVIAISQTKGEVQAGWSERDGRSALEWAGSVPSVTAGPANSRTRYPEEDPGLDEVAWAVS